MRHPAAAVALSILLYASSAYCQSDSQANYAAKCQACHGVTGAGETPVGKMLKVKPFSDPQILIMTDASLTNVIAKGSGKMPGYQNQFSSDQIADLVVYLHQLQAKLQGN